MTSNKKLRARGRRDRPGSGPNYDKAHGLIPRQPDPPKKGKYPNSPPPLIELVVKWCKQHGYHRAIHAIKTETQKREATGGYTKPCSWDNASNRYPTLVEIFEEWKKMHPEIPEWMPASEHHAKYILPDALKREEERKRKEEEAKRKEERRKRDERGDFSDTSISDDNEEEEDKEAAAGAPITPAESAEEKGGARAAKEESDSEDSESDSEPKEEKKHAVTKTDLPAKNETAITDESSEESASESESESEEDKQTAKKTATKDESSEESASESESQSEGEDAAAGEKVKPENVPLPQSDSESSSEESGSEEDESEEEEEQEQPMAEVKAKANPLKRKAPASSSSSSEESDAESEPESSEEEKETKPQVDSKPTGNSLKRKAPSSSSSEEESSEEESSSDEEPKAKKAKLTDANAEEASPSEEDSDEEMKDAPNANSEDSSEEESNFESEEEETKPAIKQEPKNPPKLDTKAPSLTKNGSASDSSLTLHATSPQFAAADTTNANKNNKPNGNAKSKQHFSRIDADQKIDPRFASNKYVGYDYAEKAHRALSVTKGRGFTKEKNKKKRGAYKGGIIDTQSRAIKFDD